MLIDKLIHLYSIVVLVAVVASWIRLDPSNPIIRVVNALTEPVLAPIRRILPPVGGLDLSPMILLLLLQAFAGWI